MCSMIHVVKEALHLKPHSLHNYIEHRTLSTDMQYSTVQCVYASVYSAFPDFVELLWNSRYDYCLMTLAVV